MNISISPFMAQVKLPHCTNFVKALVPIYGFPIKIGYYFFCTRRQRVRNRTNDATRLFYFILFFGDIGNKKRKLGII